MNILPLNLKDGYKVDHRRQYPKGTEIVYSNFTPRGSRVEGVNEIIVFGIQYFIKEYLIKQWNENFFYKNKNEVVSRYKRRIENYLGKDAITYEHIEELHDLGYLPLKIKALPEGSKCKTRVPCLTVVNTDKRFFWLTNMIETLMSCILWKPMTSATTAYQYRKEFERHSSMTGYDKNLIQFQAHDFSFRGMSGIEDAGMSGAAHLLSFLGTDSIIAIDFLEEYYGADSDKELIGCSVPATEHSVMCMGGSEDEIGTFKRLITETYPSGIVSIVSDTWDFWKVMTEYLPALKDEIQARDGRLVIRPDSGNPVDIICGEKGSLDKNIAKGAYEILWDIFGGTTNEKGFKVLNPKVGLIYGDSITIDRQKEILSRLEKKGFSASNLVLGVGSFTYEYVTRDTFGFAMKATYGEVNGKSMPIFKDPKTDNGLKKSAKGLIKVDCNGNMIDMVSRQEEEEGLLETVFLNGELIKEYTLFDIRNSINNYRREL